MATAQPEPGAQKNKKCSRKQRRHHKRRTPARTARHCPRKMAATPTFLSNHSLEMCVPTTVELRLLERVSDWFAWHPIPSAHSKRRQDGNKQCYESQSVTLSDVFRPGSWS